MTSVAMATNRQDRMENRQHDFFTDTRFDSFLTFHRNNPRVYRLFEMYALEAIASGRKHYSARAIMERVRWDCEITTRGGQFKINNNHFPWYAKMFMEIHPEQSGFFMTRNQNAV